MTATTIIHVPLTKLRPGGEDINARKTKTEVDGLARSIAAHGLLVPLLVRANGKDSYDVMDGNRRHAALQLLAKDKGKTFTVSNEMPVLAAIPCVEVTHNNALELSMVVNIDRANLHPVDRFEVLAALVQAGDTVEAIGKRYGMKISEVRQALALGRMAPAVRDAWRAGSINAETAEAFTITTDHKAQEKALKKVGKHGGEWQVRRELTGEDGADVDAMLKIIGLANYEKAGHFVNATLFSDRRKENVSDIAALKSMFDDKLAQHCNDLIEQGWKWAISKAQAPKDLHAWRRVQQGSYSKDVMAGMGCVVGVGHDGRLEVARGYVKPGDSVKIPKPKKSPKEQKAAAKERADRKEETGGISNALALRLSEQLTAAVRDAMPLGIENEDAICLTIAVLACRNEATPHVKLTHEGFGSPDDGREENEFGKYFKLALSKTPTERCRLLLTWLAKAVDLTAHDGGRLNAHLHPDKEDDQAPKLIVSLINAKKMIAAAQENFDATDYFSSVSKALIVEAVTEAIDKATAAKVAKMKTGDAQKFALANLLKSGWVPPSMRLGKA